MRVLLPYIDKKDEYLRTPISPHFPPPEHLWTQETSRITTPQHRRETIRYNKKASILQTMGRCCQGEYQGAQTIWLTVAFSLGTWDIYFLDIYSCFCLQVLVKGKNIPENAIIAGEERRQPLYIARTFYEVNFLSLSTFCWMLTLHWRAGSVSRCNFSIQHI